MLWTISKLIIASTVITLASWLAGKKPALAGFLIALPISSMIALALSYAEYRDPEKSVQFAQSILAAVPLSLTFFLPFLFAEKLKLPFPVLFIAGIALLGASYLLHRRVFGGVA